MGPASTSKDLLHLESKSPPSSSLESALLLRKNDCSSNPTTRSGKLVTCSVPKSQVLGKLKDFLGVMAEANTRLQHDAKEKSSLDYDIEEVTGNETEDAEMVTGNETKYIQMDLVLGVVDLKTPESVAATEAAIAGSQSVPLVGGCGSSDTSSDDDDSDDNSADDGNNGEVCSSKLAGSTTDKEVVLSNYQSKKRQRIIELS